MFSSRNFIVSILTYKSLIDAQLIFIYGIRVQFHYFPCGYSVSSILFIEEIVFFPLYVLGAIFKD